MARNDHGRRSVAAMLPVVLSAVCLTLFLLASPAAAQEDCYPDGCTEPTNPPPSGDVTCELSIEVGDPGENLTAVVRDVPAGGVRILFDGVEVASSTDSGAEVRLVFAVPDVEPGTYTVVASGPTFSAECTVSFRVGDDVDVAGEGASGGAADGSAVQGGSTGRGSSGGALPFTGAQTALLVAIALAMLIAGAKLVSVARRRRAAHAAR